MNNDAYEIIIFFNEIIRMFILSLLRNASSRNDTFAKMPQSKIKVRKSVG